MKGVSSQINTFCLDRVGVNSQNLLCFDDAIHSFGRSLLECNRIIKTLDSADRSAVLSFLDWWKKRKEWWVLVERKNVKGKRYFKRDFRFFRVYNRFDEPYVKRVIKKFELIKFFSEDRSFVHFVLTVERKYSIGESIRLIRRNWNRLRALLKKKLGKNYPFIAVLEPHKDGYPHLHVLLFTEKFVFKHDELSAWCKEHGLGYVVWLRRYWANGFRKKPIFYLIKYLSKQFKKDWNFGELVFYANLWFLGAKAYTFSRYFNIPYRKKARLWKLVYIGSLSEINVILKVNFEIYCFDHPLEYFSWSEKLRFLWHLK